MIKTVLVDDEQDIVSSLTKMLQRHCPEVSICGTADSVISGRDLIESVKPELVLLDIEMTDGSGFDLLKSLSTPSFHLIFVTAYSDYALKAIKFSAVDYILKPIDVDDLKSAISKVSLKLNQKTENRELYALIDNLKNKGPYHNKMAIPTIEGLEFIDMADILYFQSDGHYTRIEMIREKSIFSSKRIGEFEILLPYHVFCRVHNSYIINLAHIRKYIKGKGGLVVMSNGKSIDVSVRKKETFLALFGNKNV